MGTEFQLVLYPPRALISASGTTEIANRESQFNNAEIYPQLPDREYRYRPEARTTRASRKEKALLKEGLRLPGGEGGIHTFHTTGINHSDSMFYQVNRVLFESGTSEICISNRCKKLN